jgi:hypothetical protein
MKTYGGVDVQTHIFLTSALAGVEWSASLPGSFIPGKRASGTQSRSGHCEEEKILDPTGNRTLIHRLSSLLLVAIPTILYSLLLKFNEKLYNYCDL